MTVKHKIGRLSLADEKFIRQNTGVLSVEKIAENLNRNVKPIQKYIDDNKLRVAESADGDPEAARINLRAQLYNREYWGDVKRQFTDDEIKSFEENWINLMQQFREDVLYAEELALKHYLTLEILINRNMQERKRATQDIENLQKALDTEYTQDKDNRDMAMIASLESQLSFARAAIPAYAAEYTKLLDKHQSVNKDLKATRDQRIKRIEDSKSSWAGFLRALEDEEKRERIGDDAELMKIAKDRASTKLGAYHTYIDGGIDRPLLNAETVEQE